MDRKLQSGEWIGIGLIVLVVVTGVFLIGFDDKGMMRISGMPTAEFDFAYGDSTYTAQQRTYGSNTVYVVDDLLYWGDKPIVINPADGSLAGYIHENTYRTSPIIVTGYIYDIIDTSIPVGTVQSFGTVSVEWPEPVQTPTVEREVTPEEPAILDDIALMEDNIISYLNEYVTAGLRQRKIWHYLIFRGMLILLLLQDKVVPMHRMR